MGIFEKFAKAYRVHDSRTYRETIASVEKVADVCLGQLATRSEREKEQIIRRVTELSEKLQEATVGESPLVVALTLLTALRVHQQVVGK
jgi:hypothetical protein